MPKNPKQPQGSEGKKNSDSDTGKNDDERVRYRYYYDDAHGYQEYHPEKDDEPESED